MRGARSTLVERALLRTLGLPRQFFTASAHKRNGEALFIRPLQKLDRYPF
jgi:hypothetical protein